MAEAFIQRLPGLSPARHFSLELGLQGGFIILCLLQSRLMALLLVSQLLGQAVTLQDQGVVLGFLGTKGACASLSCPLKSALASASTKDKRKTSKVKLSGKIRPDCTAVGPNLGDYTQWVR